MKKIHPMRRENIRFRLFQKPVVERSTLALRWNQSDLTSKALLNPVGVTPRNSRSFKAAFV